MASGLKKKTPATWTRCAIAVVQLTRAILNVGHLLGYF